MQKGRTFKTLLMGALVVCVTTALVLVGCSSQPRQNDTEPPPASNTEATEAPTALPTSINIMALKGPTAMGMVQMMSEADAGNITSNAYRFSIAATIDEVPPAIAKGDIDIAAVPANLASVLYNNTSGEVKVLAINTLGVLYLVENNESLTSLDQLRGKTIYASGKGATPEYALNYILQQNGIDPATDVTIEWLPEHSACVTSLASNPDAVALLPQPFVTTAQTNNPELHVAFDLTAEWDLLNNGSTLITGVVIARASFIEEHPEAVADFLARYEQSVDFVNSDVAAAAALIGGYDIVPEAIAQKALPQCNVVFISGADMEAKLSGYLQTLYDQNPASVGESLPTADFYYRG